MKNLARLEELAQIVLSVYLFAFLPFAWWIFPVFFFAPDLSLIGLLVNKRVGAITYNLIHRKGVALSVYILGGLLGSPLLSLAGVLLLGHASFDRMLGLSLLDINSLDQPALESISQRT